MRAESRLRARFDAHRRDEHKIARGSRNLRAIFTDSKDGIVTTLAMAAGFAAGAAGGSTAALGTPAVLAFGLAFRL